MTSAKTPLKFVLLWTIATFGGFLASLCWIEIGERAEIGVLQAAMGGIAIAIPQSLILRENIYTIRWIILTITAWVILTVIGMGAFGWSVPASETLSVRLYFGALHGAFGGFAIGLSQWLTIRKPKPWAWQWMIVNSLCWAVALPVGSAVGILLHQLTRLFLAEVVGLAITWLIVAILTGFNIHKLISE
ncbi:hypothetical protein CLI64_19680 [Nostoc sp. CENA543]|uniref:hypothetical protein n=1 Tax=Nostoc sp. CENA543 TaxID=1869241 RepID=UPI000CA2A155|nr:hypothetical protein [Nostoc sp. CENA543]AUT02431.1 hypothetical protein CLI64_19680 [Nostoc sp. CENA543]